MKAALHTLALLLVCCSFNATGDTNATEPLQLVTGEFAPFTGKDLPHGGIVTDIVARVLQLNGQPVEFSYLPWKRGYQETLKNKFLATFPYSINDERSQYFYFSDPILQGNIYFFVHADSPWQYQTLEDLKGMRLCTGIGFNVFPPIQEALDRGLITLQRVQDIHSCFRMIKAGRVDATFLRNIVGKQMLMQDFGSTQGFRTLPKSIQVVSEHLILSKTNPQANAFLTSFNATLKRLRDAGVIDQIIATYLSH